MLQLGTQKRNGVLYMSDFFRTSCFPALGISIFGAVSCFAAPTTFSRWADVSESIQGQTAEVLNMGSAVSKSTANNPQLKNAVSRLSRWVDRFDTYLRQLPPDQQIYNMTLIPKPHLMVTLSNGVDAEATNAPVCVAIAVRLEGGEGEASCPSYLFDQ